MIYHPDMQGAARHPLWVSAHSHRLAALEAHSRRLTRPVTAIKVPLAVTAETKPENIERPVVVVVMAVKLTLSAARLTFFRLYEATIPNGSRNHYVSRMGAPLVLNVKRHTGSDLTRHREPQRLQRWGCRFLARCP